METSRGYEYVILYIGVSMVKGRWMGKVSWVVGVYIDRSIDRHTDSS